MNSSNLERKSRIAYKPEEFLSMNVAQLFTPGFSPPLHLLVARIP
jgi:hypothetical protein